ESLTGFESKDSESVASSSYRDNCGHLRYSSPYEREKIMILLVDDDHAITQVLKDLLSKEGYDVCIAGNGEDAYAILKEKSCRGVLLDLMMPGINGAGLLMLLSAEGIKVPVVIMAGSPDF